MRWTLQDLGNARDSDECRSSQVESEYRPTRHAYSLEKSSRKRVGTVAGDEERKTRESAVCCILAAARRVAGPRPGRERLC